MLLPFVILWHLLCNNRVTKDDSIIVQYARLYNCTRLLARPLIIMYGHLSYSFYQMLETSLMHMLIYHFFNMSITETRTVASIQLSANFTLTEENNQSCWACVNEYTEEYVVLRVSGQGKQH